MRPGDDGSATRALTRGTFLVHAYRAGHTSNVGCHIEAIMGLMEAAREEIEGTDSNFMLTLTTTHGQRFDALEGLPVWDRREQELIVMNVKHDPEGEELVIALEDIDTLIWEEV